MEKSYFVPFCRFLNLFKNHTMTFIKYKLNKLYAYAYNLIN